MITFKFVRNASNYLEVSEDGNLFATIKDPAPKVSLEGGNLLKVSYLGGSPIFISPSKAQIQLPSESEPTSLSAAAIVGLSLEQLVLKLIEGLAPVAISSGGGDVTATGLKTMMKSLPGYDENIDQTVIIKNDALTLQPVAINVL